MKARVVVLGIFFVILMCSASAMTALAFPAQFPVPLVYPNVVGVWNGSGTSAHPVAFTPYQMNINILDQQGSLFYGLVTFFTSADGSNGLAGVASGHITLDRQVTMTIHAGSITSGLVNFPATHLFYGQLTGDKKRIDGVLQYLENSETIKILFIKE